MSLSSEYRRQLGWRDWGSVFAGFPLRRGETVLDLGCGVGDQAAMLVARGARVIGVDGNEDLLREARERKLENAEFRHGDLREPMEAGVVVDGVWCSFAAAYLTDLSAALAAWSAHIRPGGWIALTEIDDFFGHVPLGARAKALLHAYSREALDAKRYDFYMGHKLRRHLERAGFTVSRELVLADRELAFAGPALPEVVEAWRTRLERMQLLRAFSGAEFDALRDEFLECLMRPNHRATARVYCCVARK